MRRLERWIGTALMAGILIAAGAAAEEPRHLDGGAAVSAADAKARCVAALVKPGEATCRCMSPEPATSTASCFMSGRTTPGTMSWSS